MALCILITGCVSHSTIQPSYHISDEEINRRLKYEQEKDDKEKEVSRAENAARIYYRQSKAFIFIKENFDKAPECGRRLARYKGDSIRLFNEHLQSQLENHYIIHDEDPSIKDLERKCGATAAIVYEITCQGSNHMINGKYGTTYIKTCGDTTYVR